MRVGHVIPFGWDTSIYTHPLCVVVPTVIAMSPEECCEYDSILHRKVVDRLFHITNREPLELAELEELSMLIVRADPEDCNHFPFWVAQVGKIEKDRET